MTKRKNIIFGNGLMVMGSAIIGGLITKVPKDELLIIMLFFVGLGGAVYGAILLEEKN